jgi:hypothetical protein
MSNLLFCQRRNVFFIIWHALRSMIFNYLNCCGKGRNGFNHAPHPNLSKGFICVNGNFVESNIGSSHIWGSGSV